MLELHLEKLRSFYVTAQHGSLVKASQQLHLTQPAVGKNVKTLEDLMGTQLFYRHRRGVTMTKTGEELYLFCETLFLKVKDIELRLQDKKNLAGVIRIGTYETLGETFWPRALMVLKKKYPELSVELDTREEYLWSKLESGGVDIVVDAEPKTSDQYFSQVLYRDRFGLFYSHQASLSLETPMPMTFVQHACDMNGESIEGHLRKLKVPYTLSYNVGSFTLARSLIKTGLCVGVLPMALSESPGIKPFLWKGKVCQFGEHRICATVHHSMKSDPSLKTVIEVLKGLAL